MNRITLKASFGALAIAGLFNLSSCSPDPDPVVPGLTDYCGDVSGPTTWSNSRTGVDYRVSCIITVTSEMVIEEGTEIEFKDGAGIIIEDGGSLKVNGSATGVVMMHGSTSSTGVWKGLWFKSNSNNNELKHCTITGAGQESFNGHDIKANVRLSLNGKLGIMNTTISNSGRDGLFVEGLDDDFTDPLRVFSGNTFSGNAGLPVSLLAASVGTLDGAGSAYTSNGRNYIEVRGGRVYGDHSWNKNVIPYLVSGELRSGYYGEIGNLTINAGVEMKFQADMGLRTGEYSAGYIKILGSATEPVSMSSMDGAAWRGICFQNSNTLNRLSYVNIDKGGSGIFTGADGKKGNVVIGGYSAGNATIDNCTISNSVAYGIYVTSPSGTPTVTNVTYSGNASGNYYDEP
jgi:hypothetical protein